MIARIHIGYLPNVHCYNFILQLTVLNVVNRYGILSSIDCDMYVMA